MFFFSFLLASLLALPGIAGAGSKGVALVISREIRPYMVMAGALEESLELPVTRFFMDGGRPFRAGTEAALKISDFSAIVAVGPQALSFFTAGPLPVPVLYGMVLNPEKIIGDEENICGVSLNIFSLDQFAQIRRIIPSIRKIGIIYNPENSSGWFESAENSALITGVELIPLRVKNRSEISGLFGKDLPDMDAILFIPDPTVISQTIIRYIIKQALIYKIPTIGYNRFFYEAGSVMSFEIDYARVGRQVAREVEKALVPEPSMPQRPGYRILINEKVSETLNLKIRNPASSEGEVVR